jgi:hypothetical protein
MGHEKKGSSAMKKETPMHNMSGMHIKMHKDGDGKITGHTVTHEMEPAMASKSGAFMERPASPSFPFKAGQNKELMNHIQTHLGGGMAPKGKENDADEGMAEDGEVGD